MYAVSSSMHAPPPQPPPPDAAVARDDFELELAEALEASRREPSGSERLASELEFGTDARTHGRALASKYWVSQTLDVDDVLDASADGFYDVWGDAFESSADGRLPELADLLRNPPRFADDEAILVDRRTDMFLSSLDELARETCAMAPSTRARAASLARLVSDRLGGPTRGDDDPMLAAEVARDREQLLENSTGCVLHVGHLSKGQERHRAVLFKALAAACDVPCRLVRGEYYCNDDSGKPSSARAAKIILAIPGDEDECWVDLMTCAGMLRSTTAASDGRAPPTPPPYDPFAEKSPKVWSATRAKGKTPLVQPMESSSYDSSIEDLLAFASFASPTPSRADAVDAASKLDADTDTDADTDVVVALSVAHGVSMQTARLAIALADDTEKANYLCNAVGAILEDADEDEVEAENVLLQDMFNALCAARWMVNDAIDAYKAQRRSTHHRRQQEKDRVQLALGTEDAEEKLQREDAERVRRREDKHRKAHTDLRKATEDRVEKFREDHAKSHEAQATAEALRVEFRAEWLEKIKASSLSETLEQFGVSVEGGVHANAKQLRKAYRVALLKFHPDRQRGKTQRERVYAEEVFKIISEKTESHA
jgi:transglutaminase-like putative cysteine protease